MSRNSSLSVRGIGDETPIVMPDGRREGGGKPKKRPNESAKQPQESAAKPGISRNRWKEWLSTNARAAEKLKKKLDVLRPKQQVLKLVLGRQKQHC
jgi:hypothetical protein